jgi:hypothetical protein
LTNCGFTEQVATRLAALGHLTAFHQIRPATMPNEGAVIAYAAESRRPGAGLV